MKPSAQSIGVSNEMLPSPERREPVEDLHARSGRRCTSDADHEERVERRSAGPTANMWSPQTSSEKNAIATVEQRDRPVAEDRLPGEDRDDLGDDPDRRQDQDVDLGVAEEPEEVLVEDRAAAVGRVEEVACRRGGRAASSSARPTNIGQHERRAASAYASTDQTNSGIRIQVMPRARMLWIVTDEVDRAGERGRATSMCRPRIQKSWPRARRVQRRERRVGGPAGLGRAALGEEAQVEDHAAEEVEPVRERVQARERHVAARRSSAARGSSPKPARIGTMTRKIIVVPWIVSTSL